MWKGNKTAIQYHINPSKNLLFSWWFYLVTVPGSFLPTAQKAKHQDDEIAAEKKFNHKAAMWGSESMSLKSPSPKIRTQGYLCDGRQGGLKCGERWLEVRRGEVIDDVCKRSQTPCLFIGCMLTKWQCEHDLRVKFLASWHQNVAYQIPAWALLMSWWSQPAWTGQGGPDSWKISQTSITMVTQAPGRCYL